MHVQTSYTESSKGTLFIVPTPIGNLEDITFRALQTLKKVDFIAAEDTRHTQKLLTHFEIKNTLISFHEHTKESRLNQIINHLERGKEIALVSDAGMPAISDPGHDLVKESIARELNVVVLPGANAALVALVGSGLPTNEFLFHGFLPRKNREKEATLTRLKGMQATLIFYESPYRVKDTLQTIRKQLGNRQISIAREISKVFEQYIRGSVEKVLQWVEENVIKGECCIIVEGTMEEVEANPLWWSSLTIPEHVLHYERQEGLQHKAAMKRVAMDRNISRRDVYQQVHVKK